MLTQEDLTAIRERLENSDFSRVDADRRALLRHAADMQAWVDRLQAGTQVSCVYCGHDYGPNETTPRTMADALKEHVEQCPRHPMSALKTRVTKLRDALMSISAHYNHHLCDNLVCVGNCPVYLARRALDTL